MELRWTLVAFSLGFQLASCGCQSQAYRQFAPQPELTGDRTPPAASVDESTRTTAANDPLQPGQHLPVRPNADEIELVHMEQLIEPPDPSNGIEGLEPLPLPGGEGPIVSPEHLRVKPQIALSLSEVVQSIRLHFPLIQQAAAARGVASGQALSAMGAFDHQLDAFSESQPLDFYKNYRQSLGLQRETMWGGKTFAKYRVGRGSYEPWYLERETNAGGEFKAGFVAPIIRDRWIDENRAELWRAQLERRRIEPEILSQIILFVRDGSVAYWDWVAAGEIYRVAAGLLELAEERNDGLREQVKAQEKAEIDLVDNQRIIVSREAKLIDARRKLEQSAVKLSLFFRSSSGQPVVLNGEQLPGEFEVLAPWNGQNLALPSDGDDASLALSQRPELAELQIVRQQLSVELRQANNETLPDVDGGLLAGQDMGEPTSPKRDKSQFELEALLTVSVPLERRKAAGKVRSLQSKLAQLQAKYRFTADKIVADVRIARAALVAASQRVEKAKESLALAKQMQAAERELFEQGQSTLFNLNIREQQAAEAASAQVDALREYFVARADYSAALGYEGPTP